MSGIFIEVNESGRPVNDGGDPPAADRLYRACIG